MNSSAQAETRSVPNLKQLVHVLVVYRTRWLVPAALVAVLACTYALMRPPTWEASQALFVRNEAAGNTDSPGKFAHSDELKTVQETLLELVRSRGVLQSAMQKVGPPAKRSDRAGAWPNADEIESLRGQVKLVPPKGADFGSTEVFYVRVRHSDRQRAVALVDAICGELEVRFQQLRGAKAESMVREMEKAVDMARHDLAETTDRLRRIEQQVGSDLGELRSLQEWSAGETSLRRTVAELETQMRDVRQQQNSHRELLRLLKHAQDDPRCFATMPNRLLESHAALKRLKDGLIDAQLQTAGLLGRMSADHPLVLAAQQAEREILLHLHKELSSAVEGVVLEMQLADQREQILQRQLSDATATLERLASLRAEYSNQLGETQNRAALLAQAEERLAEARTAQATAAAASLLGRIDGPEAGTSPVGPGRAAIALLGIVGGAAFGVGVLLLSLGQRELAGPDAVATKEPTPRHAPPRGAAGNGRSGSPAPSAESAPQRSLSLEEALQKTFPVG